MATKYERGTTFRSYVYYQSGSTPIDCSGNMAYFTLYDPNGVVIIGPVSGHHVSTGTYEYFPSTQNTHDLGLYCCEWKAWFDYQSPWNFSPKIDREVIQLVYVE